MTAGVEHLSVDDLLGLAVILFGEPPPVRDLGRLEAAAARPRASAFGEEAYPDVWAKAAALLHSLVKDHPLVDGNKRLGWLACAIFLSLNDIDPTTASNDDVYDLVVRLAAGSADVDEIADGLRGVVEL